GDGDLRLVPEHVLGVPAWVQTKPPPGEHEVERVLIWIHQITAASGRHSEECVREALGPKPVEVEQQYAAVQVALVVVDAEGAHTGSLPASRHAGPGGDGSAFEGGAEQ